MTPPDRTRRALVQEWLRKADEDQEAIDLAAKVKDAVHRAIGR